MPKQANVMTATEIRNISIEGEKAKKAGLYFVGEVPGLAIQLLPTGAKTWVLRVQVGDKRRNMGLGGFPAISLADARAAARQARAKIREGIDPIEERRLAQLALRAAPRGATTFRKAAETYIEGQAPGWRSAKHEKQWSSSLAHYAYPVIGDLPVGDVDKAHLLEILRPIWATKTETAARIRGRIETILGAAKSDGLIKEHGWLNPARWPDHLEHSLARRSKVAAVKHHAAMPFAEVGDFMVRLRKVGGMGARALEFAILTAARSGEVRGATWDEIDLEAGTWTVPAGRMKMSCEHRVPLSMAALDLLKSLPRQAGSGPGIDSHFARFALAPQL